jgi:hypothetical protein
MQFGPSTCSVAHLGLSGKPETSHLVPGTGTVTVARVKSGAEPGAHQHRDRPLVPRARRAGRHVEHVLPWRVETPTVNPTPNAITEIPVNFRVEATQFDPNTGKAGWYDWVVVNVHGTTGSVPIHNNGSPKPFSAFTAPAASDHNADVVLPADRPQRGQPEPLGRARVRGPHELRLVPGRHGDDRAGRTGLPDPGEHGGGHPEDDDHAADARSTRPVAERGASCSGRRPRPRRRWSRRS